MVKVPASVSFGLEDEVILEDAAREEYVEIEKPEYVEIDPTRYRREFAGEGAQGEVDHYIDSLGEEDLAVKKLAMSRAQRFSDIDRIKREARILRGINHPNIVECRGLIEHEVPGIIGTDTVYHIVYDWINGKNLGDTSFAKSDVNDVLEQIVVGLRHCYEEHGVIHRDIKPSNIMQQEDGLVKIIDFGVARQEGETQLTVTKFGGSVGTEQYWAPELLRGEDQTHESDLYAAGVVAVELLRGKSFGKGTGPKDVREKLASMEFVDGSLRDKIEALLSNDPEERRYWRQEVAPEVIEPVVEKVKAESIDDVVGKDAGVGPFTILFGASGAATGLFVGALYPKFFGEPLGPLPIMGITGLFGAAVGGFVGGGIGAFIDYSINETKEGSKKLYNYLKEKARFFRAREYTCSLTDSEYEVHDKITGKKEWLPEDLIKLDGSVLRTGFKRRAAELSNGLKTYKITTEPFSQDLHEETLPYVVGEYEASIINTGDLLEVYDDKGEKKSLEEAFKMHDEYRKGLKTRSPRFLEKAGGIAIATLIAASAVVGSAVSIQYNSKPHPKQNNKEVLEYAVEHYHDRQLSLARELGEEAEIVFHDGKGYDFLYNGDISLIKSAIDLREAQRKGLSVMGGIDRSKRLVDFWDRALEESRQFRSHYLELEAETDIAKAQELAYKIINDVLKEK